MEIVSFIAAHWVEWLFAFATAVLSLGYRSVSKRLQEERKKNEAIAEGVQALLRENIVANYNRYAPAGVCPIYAKENIEAIFKAYEKLGGNHTAKQLYEDLMKLPTEGSDHDS